MLLSPPSVEVSAASRVPRPTQYSSSGEPSACGVLYLIGQLRSGGSERQLYYLLRAMDRRQNRPAVVVWNFSEADAYVRDIRDLDVPIYSFDDASSPAKLLHLRRLVHALQPAVVHSFSFYLNCAAACSVTSTGAVALGSMRSTLGVDKKINGWLLGRLSARWPRFQIYNSDLAARLASDSRGPFHPGRVVVVHNGVDLERFCAKPVPTRSAAHIVGVGSLLPVKRWDRLLKAAAELKRRGFCFSVEIVGDGPMRGSLQTAARNLGVSDCVTFNGHSDHVADRLADSSFVVHPSEVEGCPNAVMEAMACGRAVVATDVGDTPSLIEDGKTGFIVSSGGDTPFVERIMTLVTRRDLCQQMGAAARTKAERECGLARMVAETLAAYRAAMSPVG
jgi:L-malate glycosyltransferase